MNEDPAGEHETDKVVADGRQKSDGNVRRGRRWIDEGAHALFLAVLGVVGVLVALGISALAGVDKDVVVAAITAIVTLTAASAGHAAGFAKSRANSGTPSSRDD